MVEPMHHLAQQPRFAIGPAANHHAICTGEPQGFFGIFDRADIAIDDHRQGNGLLNVRNKFPVRMAFIHLASGAAMHRDHLRAEIFGNMGEFGCIAAIIIPTRPHFHRHRYVDRLHRRIDQRRGQRQIPHQGGTGIPVHNLFDRAAHIDVDNRRAAILVQTRCLGHHLGFATSKLHRNGFFDRIPCRFLQ